MQTVSITQKIRTYLGIIAEQFTTPLEKIENIEILDCPYKESNELPDLSLFKPYNPSGEWGTGTDSHAWFHFTTKAHPNKDNVPLILRVHCALRGWDADNPQFIIYIDGQLRQGLDINHTEVQLAPDSDHDVYVYAYVGPKLSKTRFFAELLCCHPEVRKLWYDINVPFTSINHNHPKSHEYQTIIRYLDDALNIVDMYNIPSDSFYESCARASEFLEEEFYKKVCREPRDNDPSVVCIGHTHIDCAWLWTLRQTREKVQRSFSTVVELMKRYPEYKFMSSQALLYKYLKEEAPEVYEEVKRLIKEGRWECEGAMWVEADCNLSSGESLVRQVLYGKRFFLEEFGVENRVLWLPDVFGYSAALPQILKKSDVDWFVTSKISWNELNTMPYDTFDWQGIDGTRIHSYFLTAQDKPKGGAFDVMRTTYVAHINPSMIRGTYDRYQQKQLNNEAIITFGFGDGGGGPTADDMEQHRRICRGIPGTPATKMDFAGNFLKRLEDNIEGNTRLPVWQGELYLEFHRGTYTTVAKNKKNNRQCEFLYQNTEWLASAAKVLCGTPFPKAELHEGWEMILTNQFHDIIPGSSITEVYDDSDKDYATIRTIAEKPYNEAQNVIASGISKDAGYVVFNPNSSAANGLVYSGSGIAYVENIPPKGWTTVKEFNSYCDVSVSDKTIENKFYALRFNDAMQIVSVYDKRADREVIKPGAAANELRVYADYPYNHDAWEWNNYTRENYRVLTDVEKTETVKTDVGAGIRIVRRHGSSTVTQTIMLYSELERIDFDTEIDWHETHHTLRTAFPVDINSDHATYEIQYGTIERPTHMNTTWDEMKFEVCAHKFADLSEGGYGVSLLNDCKYGHDIHDGVMCLSLLRSPTYPNPTPIDNGISTCTYSLVPHTGALDVPKIQAMAYALNNPMFAVKATGTASVLPETYSMVSTDRDNIVCEVIKEAEDGDAIIVRLFENSNSRTNATVTLGVTPKRVTLVNLMEREQCELVHEGNKVKVPFHPYEIQTLKIEI